MGRRQPHPAWTAAGEVPQQHYLIEPRHLAGAGDPRHITEYLRASGWRDRTPRSGSPVAFESPDRAVRVGYCPRGNPPSWTIAAAPHPDRPDLRWHATFDCTTPVEIVAGFTDALTQPPPPHAPNVWQQCQENGWTVGKKDHHTASSPGGSAMVQYREVDGQAVWWACANATSAAGQNTRVWNAVISSNAPLHAIENLAAALSDPQPVLRPPGDLPFAAARQVTATPFMVMPSQLRAWQQARLTMARARAWTQNRWPRGRPDRNSGPAPGPPRRRPARR